MQNAYYVAKEHRTNSLSHNDNNPHEIAVEILNAHGSIETRIYDNILYPDAYLGKLTFFCKERDETIMNVYQDGILVEQVEDKWLPSEPLHDFHLEVEKLMVADYDPLPF